ncbi:hypothetical protein ABZ835_37775 [Streptomyces sp. NPDC047461]|uniref:hypothetical protein n=1 Tax=Streptomyces sp. NPDC047461 TaxID=3155619 RepID=UPI00340E70B9
MNATRLNEATQPTGHPHPLLTEDQPREHREDVATGLDQLTAALPSAVDEAMRAALPDRYTPELAATIAETMTTLLQQGQQYPLTAAQRGPEWMAHWGCPGWCVEDHGTPQALECHSTKPAETSILAADLDCSGYSANGEGLPWMTAQTVVVNDQAQAYGRRTSVWIGYGVHLAEVSPAEARRALDSLRGFVTKLAAVVDFAEQTAADDFAGDPDVARLDREANERRADRGAGGER